MTKAQRFVWELYLWVVLFFTLRKAVSFFHPESASYLYFHILQAFDSLFLFNYFANLIQIFLNLVHVIPLALFIYRRRLFPASLWQVLFILKIIFDIAGHRYETSQFASFLHHDPLIALLLFIPSMAIYVPAYIAQFQYAFCQDKLDLKGI